MKRVDITVISEPYWGQIWCVFCVRGAESRTRHFHILDLCLEAVITRDLNIHSSAELSGITLMTEHICNEELLYI